MSLHSKFMSYPQKFIWDLLSGVFSSGRDLKRERLQDKEDKEKNHIYAKRIETLENRQSPLLDKISKLGHIFPFKNWSDRHLLRKDFKTVTGNSELNESWHRVYSKIFDTIVDARNTFRHTAGSERYEKPKPILQKCLPEIEKEIRYYNDFANRLAHSRPKEGEEHEKVIVGIRICDDIINDLKDVKKDIKAIIEKL